MEEKISKKAILGGKIEFFKKKKKRKSRWQERRIDGKKHTKSNKKKTKIWNPKKIDKNQMKTGL